jgi:hypothetical protein
MQELAKGVERWLGSIRGSRTGTLYVEAQNTGSSLVVIGFTGGGDVRLSALENDGDETVSLFLEGTKQLFGTAQIESQTDDKANGSWKFVTGAAGVFDVIRYADGPNSLTERASNLPDQVWNREIPIGAITLFRPDLQRLIAEMESLVPKPNITNVRATENGQVVVQPASKYISRLFGF